MPDALDVYAAEVRKLAESGTTAEETYYGGLSTLLTTLLRAQKLPSDVRTNTKEKREGGGLDRPDLAVYDPGGGFLLPVEIKLPKDDPRAVALGTGRNDQVGRYLAQSGVCLVTNLKTVVSVVTAPGRTGSGPVPPESRRVLATADLLSGEYAPLASGTAGLEMILEEALTHHARLADPESLARVLALQARRAKAALPSDFNSSVGKLRTDFAEALGVTFDGEDGEEFFRSSLIQTLFYGLFAGWTLQRTAPQPALFDWRLVPENLPIPFLGSLFHDINHPSRMADLGLAPFLDRAEETLGRVDETLFFAKMRPPTLNGGEDPETSAAGAITYFYEPFLEAFDPDLRRELGVWYTPPEIVRYQVAKVHGLLQTHLGFPLGLADDRVVVLDPCCGTGAYLLETLAVIARTLKEEGVGDALGTKLRKAMSDRLVGFEILTAPFVIAHLQLFLLLRSLGVKPAKGDRPAIFLTNALTGWNTGQERAKLNFPELQEEHDAAQKVKRDKKVIVVIGNPPYNRFAGQALEEEQSLVDHYKGIRRETRTRKNRETGLSEQVAAQKGKGRLFEEYGIRKSLLDDLYIRFFRLAEERFGAKAEVGILSFISNYSFLMGRSHPIMRESLLGTFSEVWVDALNGDKYKTGKTIPKGLPGAGSTDQSIFSTPADPRGIQVGTAITTWVKTRGHKEKTVVRFRDLYGLAEEKRQKLVEGTAPDYTAFTTTRAKRFKLVPYTSSGGYEDWPALDELFPTKYQGVNANRGYAASVIDFTPEEVGDRMRAYFSEMPDVDFAARHPVLMKEYASYSPQKVRAALRKHSQFYGERVLPYLVAPLDLRAIYYESEEQLLNRHRPELGNHLEDDGFLCAVPQPRRLSESKPQLPTCLFDLHFSERGVLGFPAIARSDLAIPKDQGGESLIAYELIPPDPPKANLHEKAWGILRDAYGLTGTLEDDDAKALVSRLFRAALAVGHAPRFETDHRESLAQDWLHLPIPRDRENLDALADVGDRIATLLDPLADPRSVLVELLGVRRAEFGTLRRVDQASELDPHVTYSYFGGAKGRYEPGTLPDPDERIAEALGPLGRVYLNPNTYLDGVGEHVWRYELGGYPVLKKWLGYRDAKRRPDRGLSDDELAHASSIVRRLSALLLLHPQLDTLYDRALENPFTAEELGLR